MLNDIIFPNKEVCPTNPQTIGPGIAPLLDQNFKFDEKLVEESEHYNNLRVPYEKVSGDPPLPEQLKLHQYFITTTSIVYDGKNIDPNTIVLRYTVTDNPHEDYIILQRTQYFFKYEPVINSYTYSYSLYNPKVDKSYLRPYGEWAQTSSRIEMNGNSKILGNNEIFYNFKTNDGHHLLTAPAWFSADQVCAILYLDNNADSDPIARVPASINHTIVYSTPQITLNLHTNNLPSSFFVEVF